VLKGHTEPAEIPFVTRWTHAARNDEGMMRFVTMGKLAVVLAIVGVFGYDAVALMSNSINTENDAQDAAYAASQAWHDNGGNLALAYQAAVNTVEDRGDTVLKTGFTVDPDGTIHLLLRHTVNTIVFSRIGALKHLDVTTQHGDANSDT
jgi:hypothetical protein